jgi:hypothetical protein
LPKDDIGIWSRKSILFGTLKLDKNALQCPMSSASSTEWPGFSVKNQAVNNGNFGDDIRDGGKAAKAQNCQEDTEQQASADKGAQAKARIISEAETLFNKQGFDGASMRDIAAAAEMQPASVYYHFESKEELLWAVWEKGGVELLNRVSDAIAGKTDPWQRMETAWPAPRSAHGHPTSRACASAAPSRSGWADRDHPSDRV